MPPKDKGKRKASSSPFSNKRNSRSSGSDKSEREGKKLRISLLPRGQTAVEGPLRGNGFLLADRLRKVLKFSDDRKFYTFYVEEPDGNLGEGAFGRVSKFRCKRNNKLHAVKIMDKQEAWKKIPEPWLKLSTYCEAACFTEILPQHRHVINIFRICESPKYIYYIMECLSKFDLSSSYRSFTCEEARHCFYRILETLHHLHQHGIIHCDIKLENMCVRLNDKTNPILIDFGCCGYSSTRAQISNDTFKEADVFSPRELIQMRGRPDLREPHDKEALPDILEKFLTGQTKLWDTSKPGFPAFPPKPGTSPDALALLEFIQNRRSLRNTSVAQLMEHCWFDPERALAGSSDSRSRTGESCTHLSQP